MTLVQDEADDINSILETDVIFYINSGHEVLVSRIVDVLFFEDKRISVNFSWKISVHLIVLMFGWRWILNRLATRDQLVKRRILIDDRDKCLALYFKDDESKQHIFCN